MKQKSMTNFMIRVKNEKTTKQLINGIQLYLFELIARDTALEMKFIK